MAASNVKTQGMTYKHILTLITCMMCIFGPTAIMYSCAGMNYKGVANYLGVQVSNVSFYMTILYMGIVVFAAPLGNLMEKYDQRIVVTICAVFCGLPELLMSTFTDLWQWYVAGFCEGIGITVVEWLLVTGCVNKWFKKGTGFFLGLCFCMTGVGGVVFNLVGQTVLAGDITKWRECYVVYGVAMLVLSLPFTIFCFRGSPAEWGTIAYGEELAENGEAQVERELPGMDYKEAVRKPYFWVLMLAGALMNCIGIMPQLYTTYIQFLAYDGFDGNAVVALLALFGTLEAFVQGGQACGKIIIGTVESKSIFVALILGIVGGVGGCFLMWMGGESGVLNMLWVGGVMYGLIYPFVTTLHPYLTRCIFGEKDYEKIFSRVLIITQLLGAFAATGWAVIYEQFTWRGFWIAGIVLIIATVIVTWIATVWGLKATEHAYDPHVQGKASETQEPAAA